MFSKSPAVLIGTAFINSPSHYFLMTKSLSRPASTQSFASASDDDNDTCKPRILCLHGKFQSADVFSNKIAGARRKIAREYDLHFLDGPIILEENEDARAWWLRLDDGSHTMVQEALDYVAEQTQNHKYDAIIGFSQGGTLATALALSGLLPKVKAVVTAGAPHIPEAFEVANKLAESQPDWSVEVGKNIPKFHLGGETDAMVSLDWTRSLVESGGNGKFVIHEQGHLFPTRSARVKEILDFLGGELLENK